MSPSTTVSAQAPVSRGKTEASRWAGGEQCQAPWALPGALTGNHTCSPAPQSLLSALTCPKPWTCIGLHWRWDRATPLPCTGTFPEQAERQREQCCSCRCLANPWRCGSLPSCLLLFGSLEHFHGPVLDQRPAVLCLASLDMSSRGCSHLPHLRHSKAPRHIIDSSAPFNPKAS